MGRWMRLAARRLSPRVAALVAAVVLAASVAVGYVAGGDFGDAGRLDERAAETPGRAAPQLVPRPGSGQQAPAFSLAAFGGGGTISNADFAGTPLVLNFWASWCPFCIAEMPGLESINKRFAGAVAFLGVDLQDDRGLAGDLIERTGVTYRIAEDPDGSLFREVRGLGMPTTLLITADGHIAKKITGPIEAAELERLVMTHLVEEVR